MKFFLRSVISAVVVLAPLWILSYPFLDNYFYADDFWHLAFAKFSTDYLGVLHRPFFGDVFWRPLTIITDVWTYNYKGADPRVFHTVDLGLHSLNALLVVILIGSLLRERVESKNWRIAAATAGGLVFALHPISLMTAAWFACRADLLGAFGYLLTMIITVRIGVRRPWTMLPAMIPAMFSLLCKETMITLPVMVFMAGFIFAGIEPRTFRQRVSRAVLISLPVLIVTKIYLYWRIQLLGQLGGYEPLQFSLSFLWPRLKFHLPRLVQLSSRDLLFHHYDTANLPGILMVIMICLFAGIGVLSIFIRSAKAKDNLRQPLLIGLFWIIVTMLPLWNVSHMLVQHEERLLYLTLIGMVIGLCCIAASPRSAGIKIMILAFMLSLSAFYSRVSWESLSKFFEEGTFNRDLVSGLELTLKSLGQPGAEKRVYIAGLGPEQYYLDPMLKVELPQEYLGYRFMLAEHKSLTWQVLSNTGKEFNAQTKAKDIRALPEQRFFYTDPGNYLVEITPPDMLLAAALDPKSQILEWKAGQLGHLKPDLIKLYGQRTFMMQKFGLRAMLLPSWGFIRSDAAMEWTLSPGLTMNNKIRKGALYEFVAGNNDPYLFSPRLNFPSFGPSALEIEMKQEARAYLPPAESEAALFWQGDNYDTWSRDWQFRFPIIADGKFHVYRIDLMKILNWYRADMVTKIRLDPQSYPGRFQIKRIEFLP